MMERGAILFIISLGGLAIGFDNSSSVFAKTLIMISFLGFIIAYEVSNGSILNFYVPEIVQQKISSIGVMINSLL